LILYEGSKNPIFAWSLVYFDKFLFFLYKEFFYYKDYLMEWLFLLLLGFGTFIYACIKTPEKAFLNVYISVLILTPQIFSAKIPGLPELNFGQITVIPIFLVALIIAIVVKEKINNFYVGILDLLILGYVICQMISEYLNWSGREATNVLAEQLCNTLAPYLLARQYIIPRNLTIKFARRIVFLLFVVVLLSIYEFRFLANPFISIFQRLIYHEQGYEWPLLLRYGFKRIGGSFVQPILFAMGISIGIFLHYWLCKNKLWRKTFKYLPISFFRKPLIITLVLGIGLIVTFSRGPLLSAVIGLLIVGIGFSKRRFQSFVIRMAIICIIGFVGYHVAKSSTEINSSVAGDTEGSAAYRFTLYNNYIGVVYQRPYWGWGRQGVPVVGDQKSIDNEYLLIALRHGLTTLTFFVAFLIWAMIRLLKRGLLDNKYENADSSLAFAFLGIIIMLSISLITVWLGLQTEPLLFIILGWISGFLHTKPKDFYEHQIAPELSKRPVTRRVVHAK
jgi:hypothetical protein